MASRAHVEQIAPVIRKALTDAGASWDSLTAVAVTKGPGLPGSLVVGVNAAKGICLGLGLPLLGINHLEGHIYSHWLEPSIDNWQLASVAASSAKLLQSTAGLFPVMVLIVSGGHTELVLMKAHGEYKVVGHTVDDAAGEAFDKVARMLQLGYPGGPEISRVARVGDSTKFAFSRPRINGTRGARTDAYEGQFDFSFSGTKTAALNLINQNGGTMPDGKLSARVPVANVAASFERCVVSWLVEATQRAVRRFNANAVLVGGGVSANRALREAMMGAFPALPVSFPPLELCTDNAAMIGAAAHFAYIRGLRDDLSMDVIPDLQLGH